MRKNNFDADQTKPGDSATKLSSDPAAYKRKAKKIGPQTAGPAVSIAAGRPLCKVGLIRLSGPRHGLS